MGRVRRVVFRRFIFVGVDGINLFDKRCLSSVMVVR